MQAVGFMRARSPAPTSPRERSESTRWIVTTSASSKSCSLLTWVTPAASARSAVRFWLQAITFMPKALLETLKARRIAGAALDVFDQEPLPAEHPLRQLDNVVLTPHLGYVLEENYRLLYRQAAENIRAFMDGKPTRVIGK